MLCPAGLHGVALRWDDQLIENIHLLILVARTAVAHGAWVLTHVCTANVTGAETRMYNFS